MKRQLRGWGWAGKVGGGQGVRPEEVISMKAEGDCYEGNCRDEGRGEGQYRWVGTRGVKSIRRASFKEQHGQGMHKTNMARNMREGGGVVVVREVVQRWRGRQENCSN